MPADGSIDPADGLDQVIADYLRALEKQELEEQAPVDRGLLLARYPHLAEELQEFFAHRDQMERLAKPLREAARALHVRCPHCHNPIEIVEESPLTDISCPSCGSSFNLVGDATRNHVPGGIRRIGRFELLEQVGMGQFGSVWKARDTELDRTVAIKIPRRGQLSEAEAEMFLRDARAAAQLHHPHIVSVHEVGRQGDTIYIVSDFIQGATLKEWLSRRPMTPREAAELCAKLAKALHHAHEAGVVHRDLKPGNIMMDLAGEPHVVDFGLAKRDAGEITMTIDGQILGTPAYMSPEQARGQGHLVDRRADIYSLGVLLFELLSGELPFRGETRMLMVQILQDDPPSPRRLNSAVPRDLETICLKCLEKEPAKRYGSGLELAHDLERYLYGEPIRARPVRQAERTWRWCRRNPVLASFIAATVALCVIVAAVTTAGYVREAGLNKDLLNEQQRTTALKQSVSDLEQRRSHLDSSLEGRQQELYRTLIQLAHREWKSGDVERADYYLNQCPPQLRNKDWHNLKHLCHPEVVQFDGQECVAISAEGRFIASLAADNHIKVWDLASGRLLHDLPGHRDKVSALAFSPGSGTLACTVNHRVYLWKLADGSLYRTLEGHTAPVSDVAFSPQGQLASASYSPEMRQAKGLSKIHHGEVILWDVENARPQRTIPGVKFAVFDPGGARLATGEVVRSSQRGRTWQTKLVVWDLNNTSGDVEAKVGP